MRLSPCLVKGDVAKVGLLECTDTPRLLYGQLPFLLVHHGTLALHEVDRLFQLDLFVTHHGLLRCNPCLQFGNGFGVGGGVDLTHQALQVIEARAGIGHPLRRDGLNGGGIGSAIGDQFLLRW